MDQSKKSQKGNDFNKIVSSLLKSLDKKIPDFYFLEDEPKFRKKIISGNYFSHSSITLDHLGILVNNQTKQVLILLSDCTTSWRDRMKSKANEGTTIEMFTDKIKERILSYFPHLDTYEMIYNCFVIFPNAIIGTYQNTELEEKQISNGCVNINYSTSIFSSVKNLHFLDGTFRIEEYVKCIENLSKDIKNGKKFSQWSMREKWKEIYNTYDFRSNFYLLSKDLYDNIDFAQYCLKNRQKNYDLEDILEALDKYNIKYRKKISKNDAITLLYDFLEKIKKEDN